MSAPDGAGLGVEVGPMLADTAVGGFVVVAGVFFVLYLVDLTKKAKRN